MASSFQDALKSQCPWSQQSPLYPDQDRAGWIGEGILSVILSISASFSDFTRGFTKPQRIVFLWTGSREMMLRTKRLLVIVVPLHLAGEDSSVCLSLTDSQNGGKLLWDMWGEELGLAHEKIPQQCLFSTAPKQEGLLPKLRENRSLHLLLACPAIPLNPHNSKHSSTQGTTYGPMFKTSQTFICRSSAALRKKGWMTFQLRPFSNYVLDLIKARSAYCQNLKNALN